MLSQSRLKELVTYNPETGEFRSRVNRHKWWIGRKLGTPSEGYLRFQIDGHKLYLHQAAFLYMEGYIPPHVDHEDLDRSNNAWSNLRAADKQKNAANTSKRNDNRSGFKGVSFCNITKRWRASIRFNGRERNLGRYDTPQEAHAAYVRAAEQYFGEFARTA